MMSFDIVTIIWGKSYIDFFLNYVVPNYLSAKNLPLASKEYTFHSCIYTRMEDAEEIAKHSHYFKLQSLISCEILPVINDSLLEQFKGNKWSIKGYCQALALKKAQERGVAVLLLNPDVLISDGGITQCCHRIAKGARAVLVGELARVDLEGILPQLVRFYNGSSLTINDRQLSSLGIEYLHDVTCRQFWESPTFTQWPSHLYWRVGKKSLYAKFFHLHPQAIDLRGVNAKIPKILGPDDDDLLDLLGIKPDQVHIVTDSKELVCLELSSRTWWDGLGRCPSYKKWVSLIWFAYTRTNSVHREQFLNHHFFFQADEEFDREKIVFEKSLQFQRMQLPFKWMNFRLFRLMRRVIHRLERMKMIGSFFTKFCERCIY